MLSGSLTLLFAFLSVTTAIGLYQFYAPRGSAVTSLKVAGTQEQIGRGQHPANSVCVSCHTTNGELPLSGGRDVATDSPLPIGSLVSVNLTPGGPLKDWSDGEILRVLREGVDRDGHPLLVMSGNGVRYLSEEDKQAIIAYLRSERAIVNPAPNPPDQPDLHAARMAGAGLIQFRPPLEGSISAPRKAENAEYGGYVVRYQDCGFCHGKDLTGGTDPVAPHGPSLRVVKGWTLEQFTATLKTGVDPTGHTLSEAKPWRYFGRIEDVEIGAVYAYLKSLPLAQQ